MQPGLHCKVALCMPARLPERPRLLLQIAAVQVQAGGARRFRRVCHG